MASLQVVAYNVRFGDAFLVEVPDRGPDGTVTTRHILIDVGNAPSVTGVGGKDDVFEAVVDDIVARLKGTPLDLYVMTHEHLDHVQGLPYVEKERGTLRGLLKTQNAWLTASAAPDYYDSHANARKKQLQLLDMYSAVVTHLQRMEKLGMATPSLVDAIMRINNPASTKEDVDYLRSLAPSDRTFYVHRETDLRGKHPFQEAKLEVWAPEEDTSSYYTRLRPLTMGIDHLSDDKRGETASVYSMLPGVDAGTFHDLVNSQQGYMENLLEIDKAANDTSVVFSLEWRGWRLLFPGDAEMRSWKMMEQRGVLKPVHFLKVSHHASSNGTPRTDILDKVLPPGPKAERKRTALVSTWPDTYPGLPDGATLALYDPDPGSGEPRCDEKLVVREEVDPGKPLVIEFPE